MNQTILSGRLTADPKITYAQGESQNCIARYSLAVERRFRRDGQPNADFINCICFGKTAEFAEKYLHKGTKMIISGHIQTGSYTNKDGQKVYTTDVVVDNQEFAESKAASQQNAEQPTPQPQNTAKPQTASDDFMDLPDGTDEELPFH